jgi:hypothetical protein
MEFEPVLVSPSRSRRTPDPVMIGLSMVNWLVLMLLMSALLLAATMSSHAEPTGSSADISTTATR